MDAITEWLPRPLPNKRSRLALLQVRGASKGALTRFSEFLSPENILFFDGSETKIQVVESLVNTLPGRDQEAILQAIWNREREGMLGIQPDISILRGRLEGVHHIRAALGICPDGVRNPSNPCGMTRLFVLFVGPSTQTRLHAGFLVAASALFHNRQLVEKVLKLDSPDKVLEALRQSEGIVKPVNPLKRFFQKFFDFFRIHYGWGEPSL